MRHEIYLDHQDSAASETHAGFFGVFGAISALALATLWMFFGDACGGTIFCAVVPVYFVIFLVFLFAITEAVMTAVWWVVKQMETAPLHD